MGPLVVFALLIGVALTENTTCNYNTSLSFTDESSCIQPTYQTETQFTFDPLLPETSKFVYALDNLTHHNWNELSDQYTTGVARAWWIEYNSIKPDYNISIPYYTMVTTTFIKGTGATGGSNNGCEAVLSKTCIDQINEVIKSVFVGKSDSNYYDPSVWSPLATIYKNKLAKNICPSDLFEDSETMNPRNSNLTYSILALENIEKGFRNNFPSKSGVLPSGNSSWPYAINAYLDSPLASGFSNYLNKTAVTFINRQPVKQNRNNNHDISQVQWTMLCTRFSQDQIDMATGNGADAVGKSMAATLLISIATMLLVGNL